MREPVVLDRKAAAEYLGKSVGCLARWARDDVGPAFMKTGPYRQSAVLYRVRDLDAFVAAGCPLHRRGSRPAGIPEFTPPPKRQKAVAS